MIYESLDRGYLKVNLLFVVLVKIKMQVIRVDCSNLPVRPTLLTRGDLNHLGEIFLSSSKRKWTNQSYAYCTYTCCFNLLWFLFSFASRATNILFSAPSSSNCEHLFSMH